MHLLTIESTCDETAAAVINEHLAVLGAVVASQDRLHERFGGVVPEIASRAHLERMLPVVDEALRRAGIALQDVDAIAVATTPGLAGSLLVGLGITQCGFSIVDGTTLTLTLTHPLDRGRSGALKRAWHHDSAPRRTDGERNQIDQCK